ncbi:Hypothetical_protein [Hexamita inflata]|uniref:Hypothetical_protein n=1 Tax=Hexamita inflata TaxID=28002 RepID=A0AA86NIT3_9EUKA|nr:Hypothetical protein HINF_LOCUS8140 [Hexamita inflata]
MNKTTLPAHSALYEFQLMLDRIKPSPGPAKYNATQNFQAISPKKQNQPWANISYRNIQTSLQPEITPGPPELQESKIRPLSFTKAERWEAGHPLNNITKQNNQRYQNFGMSRLVHNVRDTPTPTVIDRWNQPAPNTYKLPERPISPQTISRSPRSPQRIIDKKDQAPGPGDYNIKYEVTSKPVKTKSLNQGYRKTNGWFM